jgi:hypothetical protein
VAPVRKRQMDEREEMRALLIADVADLLEWC